MKSELGELLQKIADENGVRCAVHKTKWAFYAPGKLAQGHVFYSKGTAIGGVSSDRPKRFRRKSAWKAREEPRGYVAVDC